MKNKKGITFGRIILYILFAFVIVFIIWSLVLTYRSIKDPNTSEPNVQCDFSLKYQYSSSNDYSATDYINGCYFNFYNSSNIASNYNGINLADYGVSWINSGSSTFSPYGNVLTLPLEFGSYDNLLPKNYNPSINDNTLLLSTNLLPMYEASKECIINNRVADELDSLNLFTDFASSNNSGFRSGAIVYSCNVPVNIFSFSIYFSLNGNVSVMSNVCFFIKVDSTYYQCFTDNTGSFHSSSLPVGLSSSIISRIIFPTFVNNGSTSNNGYITGWGLQYNYQNVINYINNDSFHLSLDFDIFTRSNDYQTGYIDGYNDGVANADKGLIEDNNALTSEVNSLNGRINSLESQVTQQSNIINNLNIELQQLQTGQFTFKNFFFSVADVPFKTVHSVLGFEFFGINLFRFFVGILTALGIIWLIKKIL